MDHVYVCMSLSLTLGAVPPGAGACAPPAFCVPTTADTAVAKMMSGIARTEGRIVKLCACDRVVEAVRRSWWLKLLVDINGRS